jgi:hypothetical protein
MSRKTHLVFSFLLAISIASCLWCQSFFGAIQGDITDASGALVPGASITLTNTKTGEKVSAVSDANGSYAFLTLLPSTYQMTVEKQGFSKFVQANVTVHVQSSLRLEAQLQPAGKAEIVQASTEAPLLQAEDATLGQVIADRSVDEMPLNGRNVYNLVALSAGVVPQGGAEGYATSNIFAWGNYSIGGGTANWNASIIDGAPVNVNYANLTALVPTQDAIQEFKVQTSALGPEYGHFTGGVINMTTKSGTNQFHGSAWEFLRNKVLNANDFFSNRSGIPRGAFTQNQYGTSVGGPIVKDKAFFFFSWEGFSLRQGQTYTYTVPTPAMLGGDFSQLTPLGVKITDPTTGQQFMGCGGTQPNVICPNRLNTSALNLMRLDWPAPTNSNVTNNFVQSTSGGVNANQYNARVDQRIGGKQSVFVRYTGWKSDGLAMNLGNRFFRAPQNWFSQQLVAGDTLTLNPSTIVDLRAALFRFTYDAKPPTAREFNFSKQLGWPASLQNQFFIPLPPSIYSSTLFFSLPNQVLNDQNTSFSFAPSITKISGKHTIKAGTDLRKNYFNYLQSWSSGVFFAFGTNTGYPTSDLAIGLPTQAQAVQVHKPASLEAYQAYYVGDSYRATKKLTLLYGVRWELPSPWTERHDLQTSFFPNRPNALVPNYLGNVELVNSPGNPGRYASEPHRLLFAPRAGVAYSLDPTTVIRSGYGLFYIPLDGEISFSPNFDPVNSATTTVFPTATNGYNFSNPWPNGVNQPPGRSPSFQTATLGQQLYTIQHSFRYGYNQQWNVSVERQIGARSSITAAYAGSFGVHLPVPGGVGEQINPLPESARKQAEAQAAAHQPVTIMQPVANPFYGLVTVGSLAGPSIPAGQLLRKYRQFSAIQDSSGFDRASRYNSLQLSFEHRFEGGGTFRAAYTYSHVSGSSDTTSAWLESGGIGLSTGAQDPNNIRAEWSQSAFDTPHRLVLSFVLDLPFGKARRFASHLPSVPNALVSGWSIDGVVTFQSGFPLVFNAQATTISSVFGGGNPRPDVVAGCQKGISGSATSRLDEWFNTSCFSQPGTFSYGNEPRVDPDLRAQGIDNWNVAACRNFSITERIRLQFRSEIFNVAHRVQFGPPGTTVGTPGQFGVVTSQTNDPRLVQFAARLNW